jgi:hypothetical protein
VARTFRRATQRHVARPIDEPSKGVGRRNCRYRVRRAECGLARENAARTAFGYVDSAVSGESVVSAVSDESVVSAA